MSSRRGREGAVGASENRQGGGKKKCRSAERPSPLIMLSLHNSQGESTRIIKLMVWLFACCCCFFSLFFYSKCIYCFLFLSLSFYCIFLPRKRFDWSNDLTATEHRGRMSVFHSFLSSARREVLVMMVAIMTLRPDYKATAHLPDNSAPK